VDDRPVTVTILDTATDATADVGGFSLWWWQEEGKGACDCNRLLLGFPEHEPPDDERDYLCIGRHRYLVIAVDGSPVTSVDKLNSGYPDDLVNEFINKVT
jgi:hypothetical protein